MKEWGQWITQDSQADCLVNCMRGEIRQQSRLHKKKQDEEEKRREGGGGGNKERLT